MSRRHLTSKQHQFLQYLQDHLRTERIWPTYRELVEHFDYRSPNSVTQNLQALARKGFLRRDHNGYHLVERRPADGAIAVRGAVGAQGVDTADEQFSLVHLFPEPEGLHAYRVDAAVGRAEAMNGATYVLVDAETPPAGAMAVVFEDGQLQLRRVLPDGRLDGVASAAPRVLGRYAGHAGPYGLVRFEEAAARAVESAASAVHAAAQAVQASAAAVQTTAATVQAQASAQPAAPEPAAAVVQAVAQAAAAAAVQAVVEGAVPPIIAEIVDEPAPRA